MSSLQETLTPTLDVNMNFDTPPQLGSATSDGGYDSATPESEGNNPFGINTGGSNVALLNTDLGFLASANFSSDSLPGSADSFNSLDDQILNNNNSLITHGRRNSYTSVSSSPATSRPTNGRRPRPLSAFMMDSNNYAIHEEEPQEHGQQQLEPAFTNTPRSRNSVTFGKLPYSPIPTSPLRSTSPVRSHRQYRPKSPVRRTPASPANVTTSPFNFQPQEMQLNGSSGLQVKPAHRKGHKYKHSSVSMNLFQEPEKLPISQTQLSVIPDSYPIPNYKETVASITNNQKSRLLWSILHCGLSVGIFIVGFKFKLASLSTLAHLVFYDSLGSLLIVFVDIMSNFEVWNKSSIMYPFGLGRIEVLVGFALSASLIMVGFDLFSHFLEEAIMLWVSHEHNDETDAVAPSSHHVHSHPGAGGDHSTGWMIYELVLLITMIVSLISSNFILSYDRINEMISSTNQNVPYGHNRSTSGLLDAKIEDSESSVGNITRLQRIFKAWKRNPSHLITLTYTLFLFLAPIIPQSLTSDLAVDINEIATFAVAGLLCFNGWNLVKSLGGILLCSFPYSDYEYEKLKSKIIDQILNQDFFKPDYQIQKFFITKFNYKLFVVGVKISMKGADSDEEVRVKFEVNRIITNELASLDGESKKTHPEITIDIDRF
ncbi:ZRG17 [[Candida] subhashii]|uniref:ZRG17 n=1 Tax=[Candida] subhashii TaxID=561895 RepID=A0A8J5QPQ7_9ASCO|nr:ZRG17 [[Candida] subhashii]KAG7664148.1 ZRG17 [[Candida] subhashii]